MDVRVLHIVGIVIVALIGVLLLISGIFIKDLFISSDALEIAWGIILLLIDVVAIIGGATATPRPATFGSDGVGVKVAFTRIPVWAWIVMAGLVVIGVILSFIL